MPDQLPTPPLNDPALLERLRRREPTAFAILVHAASPRLLALAARMLKSDSDAHDALQESFLQAYKALPQFEARCSLQTWLHAITVRACLMRLRHAKTRREESIDALLPQFVPNGHRKNPGPRWRSAEQSALDSEQQSLIRRCIDQLPDDYRNVLLLRDIQEMDTHEVAQLLGVNDGVIKTRLHRARQALRTLLDPYFRKT